MKLPNIYHGHVIFSEPDEAPQNPNEKPRERADGWIHELRPLLNPRLVGGRWQATGIGELIGTYDNLADAIAEAKRLCPPDQPSGTPAE